MSRRIALIRFSDDRGRRHANAILNDLQFDRRRSANSRRSDRICAFILSHSVSRQNIDKRHDSQVERHRPLAILRRSHFNSALNDQKKKRVNHLFRQLQAPRININNQRLLAQVAFSPQST